jgi:hypothetical protein
MKNLCWLLIVLAAIATVAGGVLHVAARPLFSPPYGYWLVAVVLLLSAIAIRLMDEKK